MRLPLLKSLKFQIAAALGLLMALFIGGTVQNAYQLKQYEHNMAILNLATRLEFIAQQIYVQGMNYKENAPRDYKTYYRDVKLYYRDLMSHVMEYDTIIAAFRRGEFANMPETRDSAFTHKACPAFTKASLELYMSWSRYRQALHEALGSNPEEPRLEYASEHTINRHAELLESTNRFISIIRSDMEHHAKNDRLISHTILSISGLLAMLTLFWFFRRVIGPLGVALNGYQRVSRGDFGHQIAVQGHNEIALMNNAFNDLSARLYAIFRLIERLQRGSDLDSTLKFVVDEFKPLLPIDWVGVLILQPDARHLQLEKAYMDGHPDPAPSESVTLTGSALQEALDKEEAIHIPDLPRAQRDRPEQVLLARLNERDMQSAIVLPLPEHSGQEGVLVFAQRGGAYSQEQVELLRNIGSLVSHSLGRTVQMFEKARLAAVGEFSSSIVHEIRNPLTTISMALEYMNKAGLEERINKRASLAFRESRRMERLLEDILLYARPLKLDVRTLDLVDLVREFADLHKTLASRRWQTLSVAAPHEAVEIQGDPDRLNQVLLNLTRNAVEAAPNNSEILLSVGGDEHQAVFTIHNNGAAMDENTLARLWTPFFTTKAQGSGLGLATVRRMVEAHGGVIEVDSAEGHGTTFTITLPRS